MKKTIISILISIYFYLSYIILIISFYLFHLMFMHNVYLIGEEISGFFPEWCPFGQHKRQMTKEIMSTIGIIPVIISIVMTIIFNKVNKIKNSTDISYFDINFTQISERIKK